MRRGKFISIEGGEGAGKSTNMALVRDALEHAGVRLLCTREPGGTPFAEQIRALLLDRRDEQVQPVAELLLMFAARVQHFRTVIDPALAQGTWVLCDRFVDASVAYQGFGRELGEGLVSALHELTLDGYQPDMTLLLDMPPEQGRARVDARGERDRFELEQEAFFDRVRTGYLHLAAGDPSRFRVIDASRPIDAVADSIRAVMRDYLFSAGMTRS